MNLRITRPCPPWTARPFVFQLLLAGFWIVRLAHSQDVPILAKPDLFVPLTEPPCSYCVNQHRKRLIDPDDRVVAWLRADHNGGAIPLRHFLSGPRVVNDTYGLFFFDPDGDYVAVYRKDYGYRFHGWRRGVMVVQGPDGTLWSALTGRGIAGPRQGERLERMASLVTRWDHWLMLHPESTTYDLFDGKKYPTVALPTEMSPESRQSMGKIDTRLEPMQLVMGVEVDEAAQAFPLDTTSERACHTGQIGKESVAVLWYGPTQTAVAFSAKLDDRVLSFYADDISPDTAPFKDQETGSRWTLAGRAVDGPLRGRELTWTPSIQCRWYAWSNEYPSTTIHH